MATKNYGKIESLNPTFQDALKQFISAAAAEGHKISIGSALRTREEQTALYNEAMRKYGSNTVPGHQVAKPGNSRHESALATDLNYSSPAATKWAHANAARYGLKFPVRGENWHAELITKPTKSSTTGGTVATQAPIEKILATIRKRESGNNYTSTRKDASASGAYQFIDSTWRSAAGKEIAAKYPRAYMAPKEVQDSVARKEVQRILDANSGKVEAVPMYWFYPKGASQALKGVDVQPPGPGNPSMLTYLKGWMKDYGSTSAVLDTGAKSTGGLQSAGSSIFGAAQGLGAAVGQATGITPQVGSIQPMPLPAYTGQVELPSLAPPDQSQMAQMPFPTNMGQASMSAINSLMQMGGNGMTGKVQVFYDPKTGRTVTRPVGG